MLLMLCYAADMLLLTGRNHADIVLLRCCYPGAMLVLPACKKHIMSMYISFRYSLKYTRLQIGNCVNSTDKAVAVACHIKTHLSGLVGSVVRNPGPTLKRLQGWTQVRT